MTVKKKVALITGASCGIGFEIARQLGKQDVIVILGARTGEEAKTAAQELVSEGVEAYCSSIACNRL